MKKTKSKLKKNTKGIQKLITHFFKKKIFGYDPLLDTWNCSKCGEDMGRGNPRQYCGKYYCKEYEY